MHYIRKISLLLAAVAIGFLSAPVAQAQTVGSCEQAIGESYLDINNVRARILNNGNLFWRGSPHVYNIPKGGPSNANFTSGIWMGGQVAGQLRLAGSTYGPYEFWAGPLNDDGTPPADCSVYDRVWKVSKEDVVSYNGSGISTPDLQDWPTGLGAPTLDANGDEIDLTDQPLASRVDRKINLAAGERPAILGDQMLWWINNDRGNQHTRTDTPAMGVEVHGSAFAFNTAGAIGNTTFYKVRIMYKGSVPLENTYMGLFDDPDLGNFDDDYVGSDTTLGLGFVYNSDDDDEGGEGYGAAPPAMGYDFFQGPLVNDNGIDDNGDGQIDEDNERLAMTAFAFYNNGGGVQGDPGNGADMYNYMKGRWKDGQRFTLGGNGLGFSNIPTSFMFPGDPPGFWSEFDSDGQGSAIAPADRRFVMATGPFTIQPGDEQTLVYGIVTSFGTDNIDSVHKMKSDDALAQAVFDINFELPSPPAGPRVTTTVDDGSVLLEWGYKPTDNNFLDTYNVIDPLLSDDVTDNDYQFEGYNVIQYDDSSDQEGSLLATYDVVNGITRVIEGSGLTFVTAEGSDSGLKHSHKVAGLINYTNYEFGVQAYAYNATSGQKVYAGPISRVSVVPQKTDLVISEDAVAAALTPESDVESVKGENIGNGNVTANIVNPAAITGHSYAVEFFQLEVPDVDDGHKVSIDPLEESRARELRSKEDVRKSGSAFITTYDVMNTTTGTKVFDGTAAYDGIHSAAPEGNDVIQLDGLSLNITGAPNGFLDFSVTANAAGPLDPPDGAAADWRSFPGLGRASDRQQSTNGGHWHIATGMSGGCPSNCGNYSSFLARSIVGRNGWGPVMPYDWEIRFSSGGDYELDWWGTGIIQAGRMSIWNAGIATPDDPSDDIRWIPAILDNGGNPTWEMVANDHSSSGGADDPESDWIYFFDPVDQSAGQAGYDAWVALALAEAAAGGDGTAEWGGISTPGRIVLYNWNAGDVSDGTLDAVPLDQREPEAGTVFRMATTKPNQPGDSFAFSTDGLGARARTDAEAKSALDDIGISPNPYKGASAYEVSQLVDQVRFTNMPNQATVRIFSVSGTLIRTLVKNDSNASFPWDLATDEGLPISSGMYIIHVDSDLGEKVLKFGVVKKRVQLNTF